tara:strand:- start:634 stop:1530 length:897 start_codon:yes stop_codon:yes gene_type:complete
MIKSFYHMAHKNGKFYGDFLYSQNKGLFNNHPNFVVISGHDVAGSIEPFFEGFFTVTKVEEGNWTFGSKTYNLKATISADVNNPKAPINISDYKVNNPEFKNRYQNQFSSEVLAEDLKFFKSLLNTEIAGSCGHYEESQLLTDLSQILSQGTEKPTEIMARLGQGAFRKNVNKVWGNKSEMCALSLIQLPALLTASHIVPWKDCSGDKEHWRLDGANGILLCAHYDRLFDRHLITFERQGSSFPIKFSKLISPDIKRAVALDTSFELVPNRMKSDDLSRFRVYMGIHNETFQELEKTR